MTSLLTVARDDGRGPRRSPPSVLDKRVIRSQDRAGFIVNALLIPYLLSAIRMLESGLRHGRGHRHRHGRGLQPPDGPAAPRRPHRPRHHDGGGRESLYAEFKEPLYAPPPLLSRMVEAGLLGRKAGRGFYDYERRPMSRACARRRRSASTATTGE